MGTYINPGNQAFKRISGPNYVDKTALIGLINDRIGGDDSLICVSRPRRFGKSYAAKMLTAYYDCSCDSHELFAGKRIAKDRDYEKKQTKEEDSGGGKREIWETKNEEKSTYEEPLVVQRLLPEIKGIAIVAQGAEKNDVKDTLTELVVTLYGLETFQVRVAGMKRT